MREQRYFLCAVIALCCYGVAMGTESSKPRKKEQPKPENNQPAKPEKKPEQKQPEKKPEKKPEKQHEKKPEQPPKKPERKPEPKPEKQSEKRPDPKPEPVDSSAAIPSQLAELDWLVGEWHDEGVADGFKVRNVFRWNSKRTFLIRSYQVEEGNELTRQGTQMIGWDPVNKQIRSWLFGNEGGFAEGFWIVQHHGFQSTLSGTMPDGSRALVTQIFKRTGENTMTSHLVGVEIDGQRQPEQAAIKMRRVLDKNGR